MVHLYDRVYGCGENSSGQLGTGDLAPRYEPSAIWRLCGRGITSIAAVSNGR